MSKQYSVAEARQQFTDLLRKAEHGRVLEITRRGRPVAVLVSAREYAKLTGKQAGFAKEVATFRDSHDPEDFLPDDAFEGLRDQSAGREVDL